MRDHQKIERTFKRHVNGAFLVTAATAVYAGTTGDWSVQWLIAISAGYGLGVGIGQQIAKGEA